MHVVEQSVVLLTVQSVVLLEQSVVLLESNEPNKANLQERPIDFSYIITHIMNAHANVKV